MKTNKINVLDQSISSAAPKSRLKTSISNPKNKKPCRFPLVPRFEAKIAKVASFARLEAMRPETEEAEAIFRKHIQAHFPMRAKVYVPALTKDAFSNPERAEREANRLNLRIKLESALLRLDECFTDGGEKMKEPSKKDLFGLTALINRTCDVIAQRPPCQVWMKCRMIDRHFPKLHLQKCIASCYNRFAEVTPLRPYGQLMRFPGAAEFFAMLIALHRSDQRAIEFQWEAHAELFSKYRRVKFPLCKPKIRYEKSGQFFSPNCCIKRLGVKLEGSVAAYVAFLELQRDDLNWRNCFQDRYWTLLLWAHSLECPNFFDSLAPFNAGPIDIKKSGKEAIKNAQGLEKRQKAQIRQARSRKRKNQQA